MLTGKLTLTQMGLLLAGTYPINRAHPEHSTCEYENNSIWQTHSDSRKKERGSRQRRDQTLSTKSGGDSKRISPQ
eukprot:4802240-Pleurochrysis_carterae.AAC.2